MKIITRTTIDPAGTSFHNGYIRTTYNDLVEMFGKHMTDDGPYKVSCEWILCLNDDNIIFTIYDWKEYDNYPVDNPDKIYDFHIGTKNKQDTDKVVDALIENGEDAFVW